MADFRKLILAIAVPTLFTGLASAQVTGGVTGSPFTCAVQNVTVTPNLRAEGFTEQTGDIVLVCTGGAPLAVGSQIPTVNIQVFYNVPAVTSRLINNVSGAAGASEALLLIDEPNNGGPGSQGGYGPSLPQVSCPSVAGTNGITSGAGPNGCVQFVGTVSTSAGVFSGVPVSQTACNSFATCSVAVPGTAANIGANVYQGVVSGASVTFQGVPVLPPVSAGVSRIYRITNVRVNANGAGGGIAGGPGQVNASISISGATSLPISNPNPIVGFIQKGLTTSASSATLAQCNSQSTLGSILNFTELFGTAFKTRVDGSKVAGATNMIAPIAQNVPGTAYNSESNFIFPGLPNGANGFTAGLADFGTRLKAVFSNVPAGVTVYVSTTNVTSNANGQIAAPTGTSTAISYAQLVTSETAVDGNTVAGASFTNTFTQPSSSTNATSAVQYVAFTSTGAAIPVVWEVVNTQPQAIETISFAVWVAYTGVTQTFPPAGTSQVNLSYAPTPTNGAFSATNAGTTAVNSPIPRFADTSSAITFLTINLCSTTLLFPYVTTVTGFTTGIVIANTTTDPFKTTNQTGTCVLNWYQGANNPAASTIGPIASGTVLPLDASGTTFAGQNFSGYMIAVCNFELAHGTAVIQDIGAQHVMATYLALILPTGINARNGYGSGAAVSSTSPEQLNN